MSLLSELNMLLAPLVPVETGIFSEMTPDAYAVLTPLPDLDTLFCDNLPSYEVQEVRISLFVKGNYTALKKTIIAELRDTDVMITEKRYIGYDNDTGFHNYAIDVAKQYEIMEG